MAEKASGGVEQTGAGKKNFIQGITQKIYLMKSSGFSTVCNTKMPIINLYKDIRKRMIGLHTDCPIIDRKSVLHLLKYEFEVQICGKFWDTHYIGVLSKQSFVSVSFDSKKALDKRLNAHSSAMYEI